MNQVQQSTIAARQVPHRVDRAAGFIAVAFALAAVAMITIGQLRVDRPSPAPDAAPAQAIDGWMPAMSAANAARLERQAREATDGWASAVAARQNERSDRLASEVTDGWAGTLLK